MKYSVESGLEMLIAQRAQDEERGFLDRLRYKGSILVSDY